MNCLTLEVHFKLGFTKGEALKTAGELHSQVLHKFLKRMMQVSKIDKMLAGDLIDFYKAPKYSNKRKYSNVLVNVDVFKKYYQCFLLPSKNVD